MEDTDPVPEWSRRLVTACRDLAADPQHADRQEAWRLVYFNVMRYVRYHAARLGRVDPDEIHDLASQKTLDLMTRVERGRGRLAELEPGSVSRFLSTVARNGLITHLQRRSRAVATDFESSADVEPPTTPQEVSAEVQAESIEYARALQECAKALEERTRTAWFFRALYGMSSRDIAAHPRVALSSDQVDMRLHRGRKAVRKCMEARGHDTRDIPVGTFVRLWQELTTPEWAPQEVA